MKLRVVIYCMSFLELSLYSSSHQDLSLQESGVPRLELEQLNLHRVRTQASQAMQRIARSTSDDDMTFLKTELRIGSSLQDDETCATSELVQSTELQDDEDIFLRSEMRRGALLQSNNDGCAQSKQVLEEETIEIVLTPRTKLHRHLDDLLILEPSEQRDISFIKEVLQYRLNQCESKLFENPAYYESRVQEIAAATSYVSQQTRQLKQELEGNPLESDESDTFSNDNHDGQDTAMLAHAGARACITTPVSNHDNQQDPIVGQDGEDNQLRVSQIDTEDCLYKDI